MIIVDASLAIEIALMTPDGRSAQQSLRREDDSLGAPELLDLEVLQVLRRSTREGRIASRDAGAAITLFQALPIQRFGHRILVDRIWALRDNLTAYDAAYIALAELLDAPLWTRDRKLSSVPGHTARVEVL